VPHFHFTSVTAHLKEGLARSQFLQYLMLSISMFNKARPLSILLIKRLEGPFPFLSSRPRIGAHLPFPASLIYGLGGKVVDRPFLLLALVPLQSLPSSDCTSLSRPHRAHGGSINEAIVLALVLCSPLASCLTNSEHRVLLLYSLPDSAHEILLTCAPSSTILSPSLSILISLAIITDKRAPTSVS